MSLQEIKHRCGYHLLSNYEPRVDENNRKRCVNCDQFLPKRRRKYCSDECTNAFWVKHNWAAMRSRVLKNQKMTCQKCGTKALFNINSEDPMSGYNYVVDHKKPIALGGAEFDESNLQTLCGICNKEKTKVDQAKIAVLRHRIKRDTEFRGYDLSKFLPDANQCLGSKTK